MTAAALILHFLAHVHEARVERIERFMEAKPLAYPRTTTRNVLVVLVKAGEIERVARGVYRVVLTSNGGVRASRTDGR